MQRRTPPSPPTKHTDLTSQLIPSRARHEQKRPTSNKPRILKKRAKKGNQTNLYVPDHTRQEQTKERCAKHTLTGKDVAVVRQPGRERRAVVKRELGTSLAQPEALLKRFVLFPRRLPEPFRQ